jgi:hypothetical protein
MKADLWYEQPEQDETLIEVQSSDIGALMASRNGNSPKMTVAAG